MQQHTSSVSRCAVRCASRPWLVPRKAARLSASKIPIGTGTASRSVRAARFCTNRRKLTPAGASAADRLHHSRAASSPGCGTSSFATTEIAAGSVPRRPVRCARSARKRCGSSQCCCTSRISAPEVLRMARRPRMLRRSRRSPNMTACATRAYIMSLTTSGLLRSGARTRASRQFSSTLCRSLDRPRQCSSLATNPSSRAQCCAQQRSVAVAGCHSPARHGAAAEVKQLGDGCTSRGQGNGATADCIFGPDAERAVRACLC
eukprot:4035703-Prymnesium_polylepis.1